MFQNRLPHLHEKLMRAAIEADRDNWQIIEKALAAHDSSQARLQTRCVEWHNVGATGGLPNHRHYDSGSCVTIDIMLNPAAGGGALETLELMPDGKESPVAHRFEKGDAILFPSHKYHSVQPVTDTSAGHRQVLIMELWVGEERRCRHRCEQHFGRCAVGEANQGMWNAATGSYVAW